MAILADLKDPEVGQRIVREGVAGVVREGDKYFG